MAGSVEMLSLRKTRMPTVPLVARPVGDRIEYRGVGRIDRLDQPEPVGMRGVDLFGVGGIVAIHAERGNQHRAVDADGIHGGHHLVTGDQGEPAAE
jgi:hypothetical protein